MNWTETDSSWNKFAGEAKRHWSKLTDTDLDECRGNHDLLVGKLQTLYWITGTHARQQIGEMERRAKTAIKEES